MMQGPERQPEGGREARSAVDWDGESSNYDQFSMCELEDTAAYLDLVGIGPADTVLDVCCGPGRIAVLAAERARSVTAIDLSPRMLERARANAEARGLSNVEFRRVDWNCVLPGQNVAVHDVVIAARNLAMFDVERLSALARRTVMVQIFADAPSIPALQGVLFSSCEGEGGRALPTPGAGFGHGGPAGPPSGPQGAGGRAPSAYSELFARAYGAGFDPNVRIMPERFRKSFATREEAVAWVCSLRPDLSRGNEDRVAENCAPFIAGGDGACEFCIATTAAIIWWDVRGPAFRAS